MTDVPLPEDVPEPTRDQVVEACRRVLVDGQVKQFVLLVQLAAEMCPDELRRALAYVFDTRAAEARLAQVAVICNHAELKLADLVATTAWMEREAGPLLEDAVRQAERLTALEEKVNRSLAYVKKVVIELQAKGVLRKPQPQRSK